MSAERSYREALRWYPRSWRRANEDVMVGTLLDVADAEGRTTASKAELRDLRRSGLATRADAILPAAIRDRAAAVSLGAGTGFALVIATGQAWAPWAPDSARHGAMAVYSAEMFAPDGVVWQLLIHPGLWILAAAAALTGWTAVSRVLLLASVPASLIALAPSPEVSFYLRPSFFTLVMMAVLAVLACLGRAPRRWTLVATGATVGIIASWLLLLGPFARTYFPRGGLVDLLGSPWPLVGLLVAAVILAYRRSRVGVVAVIVASSPWLVVFAADRLIFGGVLWLLAGVPYPFSAFVVALPLMLLPLAILLAVRRYAGPSWLSPSESSDSRTSASRPSSTR